MERARPKANISRRRLILAKAGARYNSREGTAHDEPPEYIAFCQDQDVPAMVGTRSEDLRINVAAGGPEGATAQNSCCCCCVCLHCM